MTRPRKPPARPRARTTPPPGAAHSACRALVRLNTSRIRAQEMKRLQRAKQTYQDLDAQWNTYEAGDKPAYARWLRTHSGPMIEEIRAVQAESELIEHTLSLASDFHDFYYPHRPMHECAEAAVFYFAHAGQPPDGFADFFAPPEGADSGPAAGEAAAGDGPPEPEEWDDDNGGDEDMDDEDKEAFRAFFADVFGLAAPPRRPKTDRLRAIKELYRKIARRLHPDQGGSGTKAQLELWYEAQRAYAHHDQETLERICAHCDLLNTGSADAAPVSSIHRGILFFQTACRRLRRRLREVKTHPEYGFLGWSERVKARALKTALSLLRKDLHAIRRQRDYFRSELEFFRQPPIRRPTTAGKRRKTTGRMPPEDDWPANTPPAGQPGQMDFDFF